MSAPSRHQLRVLELLARDPDFTLKERFGMVTASHGVRVITTTVDALRERGLIEGTPEEAISGIYTVYRITEAGRQALEPKPPKRQRGDSLDRLANEVNEWQLATFPHATPASAAAHLLKEAKELARAPRDPEEMADVFFLVVAVARLAGVDLVAAVRAKLEENKTRTWGEPDADGVVEHVRAGVS